MSVAKNTRVPETLLLDHNLPASAKLLWMILTLPSAAALSQRALGARYHVARSTIQHALVRLETSGWAVRRESGEWAVTIPTTTTDIQDAHAGLHTKVPEQNDQHDTTAVFPDNPEVYAGMCAEVPRELLRDARVSIQARVLYGTLQLISGGGTAPSRFTHPQVSRLTGRAPQTVRNAIGLLTATGWLRTAQKNKYAPLEFRLTNPYRQQGYREVTTARARLERASFLGEALLREYLSLLVASDEYEDDASPGFLVNPFTGQEMELDRYYPPKVAFEFNGPQHYGPTAQYPDEEAIKKQQARDDMKRGICRRRGIMLVTVQAKELTLAVMRKKVEGLLPLNDLTDHEQLVSYLELVSRKYRRKARKGAA